jgi:hypothetical protein
MADGYQDWSEVEEKTGNNNSNNEIKYIKFAAGETVRVRLLSKPFFYDQYYFRKDELGSETDISIISPGDGDPLPDVGVEAKTRCAVNVFNRDDNNEVQILTCGPSIYNHFINWCKKNKINPGSGKGCDFEIEATGNGLKRRYIVTALLQTPFTKEEKALLSNKENNNGLFMLENIFKPTPVEEIKEFIGKYNIGTSSADDASFDDAPSVPSFEDDEDDDDIPF